MCADRSRALAAFAALRAALIGALAHLHRLGSARARLNLKPQPEAFDRIKGTESFAALSLSPTDLVVAFDSVRAPKLSKEESLRFRRVRERETERKRAHKHSKHKRKLGNENKRKVESVSAAQSLGGNLRPLFGACAKSCVRQLCCCIVVIFV